MATKPSEGCNCIFCNDKALASLHYLTYYEIKDIPSNIYFPDEKITFGDLYFVCYMIERVARSLKQPNRYVVERIGKDGLARQLSIADTNHCLNPNQVVSDWKRRVSS